MSEIIPFGPDRKETATLLLGTAEEFGIDIRSITVTPKGFRVPDELVEILAQEMAAEPEPEPQPKKKAPKKKAAKKTSGKPAGEPDNPEKE